VAIHGRTLRLRKSTIVHAGRARTRVVPNRVLNDVLDSDGEKLSLPGISFDPSETTDELRARIEAPLKRKRR